jgi:hypothetical protein
MTLGSCATTNYGVYNNVLSKTDIETDIRFIKRKLISQHYNLDWEGRQDKIIQSLDSLAASSRNITVKAFKKALQPIMDGIDDGHTDVMAEVEMDLRRAKSNQPFECFIIDTSTAYLKIPHFMNSAELNRVLITFDHLLTEHDADRIVIDLRNNPGGSVNLVRNFLSRTIENSTLYCHSQKTRMVSGLKPARKILLRMKATSTPENKVYTIAENEQVMIAAYHLRKDGFEVIGSAPSALFNSFMNPIFFNLPKSRLYLSISTGRFHLSDNLYNRTKDQLLPDFETKLNFSLKGLMKGIRQIEALELAPSEEESEP